MFRTALALLALAVATPALATSGEDILHITLDKAEIVELPVGTSTVVIGNPSIADVTALKGNALRMIVTGKSYGHTNMLAVDAAGKVINEQEIHVETVKGVLVVQRGTVRESYSCDAGRCMPAAILGDDPKTFSDISGAIGAHDALAKTH